MRTSHGETVRKKRTRGFDLPPDNPAEVEAHRIRWDAHVEKIHGKQGSNSQIFTKDKINHIIIALHNYDSMIWPVRSQCI